MQYCMLTVGGSIGCYNTLHPGRHPGSVQTSGSTFKDNWNSSLILKRASNLSFVVDRSWMVQGLDSQKHQIQRAPCISLDTFTNYSIQYMDLIYTAVMSEAETLAAVCVCVLYPFVLFILQLAKHQGLLQVCLIQLTGYLQWREIKRRE